MPRVNSRAVRRVVVVQCQSCGGTAERYHGATTCNRVVATRTGRDVCRGRVAEVGPSVRQQEQEHSRDDVR
jgi:hypothetical protein